MMNKLREKSVLLMCDDYDFFFIIHVDFYIHKYQCKMWKNKFNNEKLLFH